MRPQGTPFWVLNGETARHEINAKEYRKVALCKLEHKNKRNQQ